MTQEPAKSMFELISDQLLREVKIPHTRNKRGNIRYDLRGISFALLDKFLLHGLDNLLARKTWLRSQLLWPWQRAIIRYYRKNHAEYTVIRDTEMIEEILRVHGVFHPADRCNTNFAIPLILPESCRYTATCEFLRESGRRSLVPWVPNPGKAPSVKAKKDVRTRIRALQIDDQ